jgi:hypothetical protein
MFKRSTWILILVLAIVIGVYFLVKHKPFTSEQPIPTATATSYLISAADGEVLSLRIVDNQGNKIKIQKDLSNIWVITEPVISPADQALASTAGDQVGTLRIITSFETPLASIDIGLETPLYQIELGFSAGTNHQIDVGKMSPTKSGYYARLDGGKIFIVSNSGIDALIKLVSSPPYQATATP